MRIFVKQRKYLSKNDSGKQLSGDISSDTCDEFKKEAREETLKGFFNSFFTLPLVLS